MAATSAAVLARDYQGNSKTDWYLPSKDELNQMCNYAWNLTFSNTTTTCTGMSDPIRSGFSLEYYWTSSEAYRDSAQLQDFFSGLFRFAIIKEREGRVRPVRAFG